MVSFYPGPSRLDPQVQLYMQEALASGILSQNHRSRAFMELYENTWNTARHYLDIPEHYSLYFVSSATECWEIISQDLCHLNNLHLFNGAFGEKGFTINQVLHAKTTHKYPFHQEQLPSAQPYEADVIHLTQNETSNGTQLSSEWLQRLRRENPNAFITVDATSSLGGQVLPIAAADIWFASVQKCFGLPSGMAVMICSHSIIERCKQHQTFHYNSIQQQELQFTKRQTTHTPNTLGIYLLNETLRNRKTLSEVHNRLKKQAYDWYALVEDHLLFQPLIKNSALRSETIIAVKGEQKNIAAFKTHCAAQNYIIGNGYGNYKDDTFRIANFPSHQPEEIHFLQQLLLSFQ
jgi:phosphoserine aminotransferase